MDVFCLEFVSLILTSCSLGDSKLRIRKVNSFIFNEVFFMEFSRLYIYSLSDKFTPMEEMYESYLIARLFIDLKENLIRAQSFY